MRPCGRLLSASASWLNRIRCSLDFPTPIPTSICRTRPPPLQNVTHSCRPLQIRRHHQSRSPNRKLPYYFHMCPLCRRPLLPLQSCLKLSLPRPFSQSVLTLSSRASPTQFQQPVFHLSFSSPPPHQRAPHSATSAPSHPDTNCSSLHSAPPASYSHIPSLLLVDAILICYGQH